MREWILASEFALPLSAALNTDCAMDGHGYRTFLTATASLAILASCCFGQGEVRRPAPNSSPPRIYGPIARLPAVDDDSLLPKTPKEERAPTRLPVPDASDDDLLNPAPPSPHAPHSVKPKPSANGDDASAKQLPPGVDPHAACFATTNYPSAETCAQCHKQIYDEWRVSSHAYAAISPMFHKFEQTITELSRGTVGYFCMRCHAPVATIEEYPRHLPIIDAPQVFREGVTCVACHRVAERYGRVNGERRIEPGTVNDPVFGTLGGDGLREVIAK